MKRDPETIWKLTTAERNGNTLLLAIALGLGLFAGGLFALSEEPLVTRKKPIIDPADCLRQGTLDNCGTCCWELYWDEGKAQQLAACERRCRERYGTPQVAVRLTGAAGQ